MSVAEDFTIFRSSYLIPSSQVTTISARYRRITRQLNYSFRGTLSETENSLYVGSYGRDTAARGISDLDIAFRLPARLQTRYDAYRSNGQSVLLQSVRSSLLDTYPNTAIGGDGQVIVVKFSDGITFEVLPAFECDDGSYLFADTNDGGTWKTCNPRAEMKAFAVRNSATNGNLKALCRMMRIWKDWNSVPISGMLVDTLAYAFIDSWAYRDKSYHYHDFLVRDFLRYMSQQDRSQTFWRAPGSSSWVRRTGVFETGAKLSLNDAAEATEHGLAYRWSPSRRAWRRVFGPLFPDA